jgi:hypothetical protein
MRYRPLLARSGRLYANGSRRNYRVSNRQGDTKNLVCLRSGAGKLLAMFDMDESTPFRLN